MPATELLANYRTKKLSPVEATQAALARIAALNGRFNAFCRVDEEARWRPRGPPNSAGSAAKPKVWWTVFRLPSRTSSSPRAGRPCALETDLAGSILG